MDNQRPNRQSIRLHDYDYSNEGLYFITICCQDKACMFGKVSESEMILNDAGKMVSDVFHELENKFADIKCHEFIVMPNHVHCIIENVGVTLAVTRNSVDETPAGVNPAPTLLC